MRRVQLSTMPMLLVQGDLGKTLTKMSWRSHDNMATCSIFSR